MQQVQTTAAKRESAEEEYRLTTDGELLKEDFKNRLRPVLF